MKCADASMGEWVSHAATSSTIHGAQRSIHGASSKPMQVKEGTDAIILRSRRKKIININHRKMKNGGGRRRRINAFNFGSIFSFLFSLFPAFMQICVAFSVFIYFHTCVSSSVSFKSA
jgi:hypothetical protein